MKKSGIKLLKIIKWILIILLLVIVLFFIIRGIGRAINNRTPKGGINESMYVDINGTKQWISIYGENKDNPVLLYLHGGPGSPTSHYDYAFTRKWADVYTVVTWDQRNSGKSYDESQNNTELTYELMMSDGLEMTKYLCEYLGVEKITLLGHSWGTFLGSNLVLEYPEYYNCYIGTGQLVDMYENEKAFIEAATEWIGNSEEDLEYLNALTPEHLGTEHYAARNYLMEKYHYDLFRDGTDYNIIAAEIFNPYYSLSDWMTLFNSDVTVQMNFVASDEFQKFSLKDRIEYQVPYYNINGSDDYQTNYIIAQEYFDEIKAPYKQMYMMENTTHGLLESKSEEFSAILHEIAENRKIMEKSGSEE